MWWQDPARHSLSVSSSEASARSEPQSSPAQGAGPAAAYDPAAIRLEIVRSAVTHARTGEQCSGQFVVRNTGPGYRVPPDIVGPSYGIFIHDERGTLLFRRFGGWSGLRAGHEHSIRWTTKTNHLGETSEPPFLIPRPGRYKLEIRLYRGSRDDLLDVSTSYFTVS